MLRGEPCAGPYKGRPNWKMGTGDGEIDTHNNLLRNVSHL
ncbi:hypothetical protein IAD21_05029 [Abditibacteriota bacterium]|nr:hypothetical protein IAD21_05029 [Abditibacteriota bacterium]